MIFVTLGTQDKAFVRLLEMVEQAVLDCVISEEVIVQAGYTPYQSNVMRVLDYIDISQFNQYIIDASFIISHAGVGSILTGLKQNKKIIVCPRLKDLKEHTNDHQLEITHKFAEMGYVLKAENYSELKAQIQMIDQFVPNTYQSNTDNFIKNIQQFIDK